MVDIILTPEPLPPIAAAEPAIEDYAADSDITLPGKKRRAKAGTAAAEEFKPPTEDAPYMDERTRLELEHGAATLLRNQEALKAAE